MFIFQQIFRYMIGDQNFTMTLMTCQKKCQDISKNIYILKQEWIIGR